MELQAALDAVQHIPGDLVIHSDSAYVVNCFLQGWWKGWRRTNYKNRSIKNLDLWEPLIEGVVDRPAGSVRFVKVKGHSGDRMNDLADSLCVAAKKKQLPTTRNRVVRRPAR
jgi:ribonuclease HI